MSFPRKKKIDHADKEFISETVRPNMSFLQKVHCLALMSEEVSTWKVVTWSDPLVYSILYSQSPTQGYPVQEKVTVCIKTNRFFQSPNKFWIMCLSWCRSWQCLCPCQEEACNPKLPLEEDKIQFCHRTQTVNVRILHQTQI